MDESIKLGRILGVRVGINWSLLVVFLLIAYSLAGVQLPRQYPGYQGFEYWTAGVTTAFVFFASLLAHEMAHALMARRERVEVEGITLWLFGGVARIRGEASSPRTEFRITIVGPITSLIVASAFWLTGMAVDAAGLSDLLAGVLRWLGRINAILAVFNMIPAFPLDGGRVLRAWLWRTRAKVAATRIAGRVGQAFAYVLMAIGGFQIVTSSDFGGLWFVFLGWFLLNAARAEQSQVVVRDALEGVRAGEIMTRNPITAPDWLNIETFIDQFALVHRFKSFPLVAFDGSVSGLVVTARLQEVPAAERGRRRVREVGVPVDGVVLGRPDEALTTLLGRMPAEPGRALITDDAGRLLGMVTPSDVQRALGTSWLREETTQTASPPSPPASPRTELPQSRP